MSVFGREKFASTLSLSVHPFIPFPHFRPRISAGLLADILHSCRRLSARQRHQATHHPADDDSLLRLPVERHLGRGLLSQHREPAGEWNLRRQSHVAHRRTRADV